MAFEALVEAVQRGDGIAWSSLGLIVNGRETAEVLSKLRREAADSPDEGASATQRTVLGIVEAAADLLGEVAMDKSRSDQLRRNALGLLGNGADGGHDFGLKKLAELAKGGNRDALRRLATNVYGGDGHALNELATLARTESEVRSDAAEHLIGIARGREGRLPLAAAEQPDLKGADAAATGEHANPQAVAELVKIAAQTLNRKARGLSL